MKLRIIRKLNASAFAVCILAAGGSAFADVVTRTSDDMLSEFGRASFSRHGGVINGVRALQPNVADVGRGGYDQLLAQSPGTIIGTSRASVDFVKGGAATLQDKPFGRR